MFSLHDRVVLTADVPASGLVLGDVGTVVHIYRSGAALEVEFLLLDGTTAAVATVKAEQLRAVSNTDITHARHVPGVPLAACRACCAPAW